MARNRSGGSTVKVSFDLPEYLDGMSHRLERGQEALADKVDKGFKEVSTRAETLQTELTRHTELDHVVATETNNRLRLLEDDKKLRRWLGGVVLVGGVGSFTDFFFNHLPRMVTGIFK